MSVVLLFAGIAEAQQGAIGGMRGIGTSGMGGYDGPAILGRGGFGVGAQGTRGIPITASMGVAGSYDSNILGFGVDDQGNFRPTESFGVEGTVNVVGQKRAARSYYGLNYLAGYSHFTKASFFNGSNQYLAANAAKMISSRWALTGEVGAGLSNRFLGAYGFTGASELEFINLPASELFDSRVVFGSVNMNAVYFKNSRESFRFGGNASTARRKARSLADMRSYGANADWVYRVSRRTSIGVQYVFYHFDFEKIFGESDVHMVGVTMARSIGRDWQVALAATGFQQSTVGVRQIELDPVLTALLGRTTGAEVFETNNFLYGYTATVTRRVRKGSISVGANRAVTPGNGFFVTSINEGFLAMANYQVSRPFSITASSNYGRMSSLAFASGDFKGWNHSIGCNYQLGEDFSVVVRFDSRTFRLTGSTFDRSGYRVVLGVNWNPRRELLTID